MLECKHVTWKTNMDVSEGKLELSLAEDGRF
jgi:hypothetical protein